MSEQDQDIRFVVDHMLIKLGTYLRILGYDAAWHPDMRTHELIKLANGERRVFLTRNTKLPDQYPHADRVVVLGQDDPVEQFDALVKDLGLDTKSRLFSRCVKCNVELDAVPEKSIIESRVHPNVFARYDEFYTCPSCGTVFWKGTHVRNTCRKLGLESE